MIVWQLLSGSSTRCHDVGTDRHHDPARRTRDLVRQLEALGRHVELTLTG